MRRSSISASSVLLAAIGFLLAGCTPPTTPTKVEAMPQLQGQRVVDDANVLGRFEKPQLTQRLKQLDVQYNAEVVIYTTKEIPEEQSLEEYSNKLFNHWKIGKKESDSGVLLVLVTSKRQIRIEVGRGNEGPIPDMIARAIIREQMAPPFRNGDYAGGFAAAINAIEQRIKDQKK